MVVLGQVQLTDRAVAGDRGVHRRATIELNVRDCEATGVEVGVVAQRRAGGAVFLQGDAGGLVQCIGQGGEVLILDALAGDHRHRVGDFLDRLGDLAADADGTGGVGTAVLGHGAEPRGIDAGCAQFKHRVLGLWQQHVVAATAADYLEVATAEQLRETLLDAVGALQAGAVPALCEFGAERQHHPGLAGKAAEHRAEWTGSDRVGAWRFFGFGIALLAQERVDKSCLHDQCSAEQGDCEWFCGVSGTRGAAWHG
ncbi:hypothetical protein D3C77_504210 [compost metagenome]